MNQKDLSNYFNNWSHVSVPHFKHEHDVWCKENIGIRGLKWEWNIAPKAANRGKLLNNVMFMFKQEEHAVLFLLKFGGVLIEK